MTDRDLDEAGRRALDNLATAVLDRELFSTDELIEEIGRAMRRAGFPERR